MSAVTNVAGNTPGSPPYNYDVFISYSHSDQAWVTTDLLSKLEQKGLQVCIDYRDFEAGAPSVNEMRRAVTTSRKTLLVLTKNYLESAWTEFEVLMISTMDPANRQRRLIPLRKEECQLPDQIGYLTYVDFANPVDWEIEWRKLLTALQRTNHQNNGEISFAVDEGVLKQQVAETSRSAREGLEALLELMEDRQVQADVAAFEAIFETSCKQIDSLACYKDLHDLLHTLQFRCYNYLIAVLQNVRKSPDDPAIWENVFEYESTVQDIMSGLRKYSEVEALRELVPWAPGLVQNLRNLFGAVTNCDPQQMAVALKPIHQVLYIQPVMINIRLNEAARALPLPGLVRALTGLSQRLGNGRVDQTTVHKFQEGLNALSRLHVELTSLIREHDRWQQVDIELRRIEATIGQELSDLQLSWVDLKARTEPNESEILAEWAQLLKADMNKLNDSLVENDLSRAKYYFTRYRGRIGNHFYHVDTALKDLCSNLRRVGEPLSALLEIM